MAMAGEFLGISPIGLSGVPALSSEKHAASRKAGAMVMELARQNLLPSQIITRESLENAITAVAASGGSTNAVLHLIAIANEVGIKLTVDDFDRVSRNTPLLCDLKPGGKYVATDYHNAGGSRLLAARLIEAGLLHKDCIHVTGRTIAEEASDAVEAPEQDVIHPVSSPIKPTGGLVIPKGNLAPEGCVIKVAATVALSTAAPARVFDCEEDAFRAVDSGSIKPNEVLVIRYEGPKEGRACARCFRSPPRSLRFPLSDRQPCSPMAASRATRGLYGQPCRAKAAVSGPSQPSARRHHPLIS